MDKIQQISKIKKEICELEKELIEELIKNDYSSRKIAEKLNVSRSHVRRVYVKYGLIPPGGIKHKRFVIDNKLKCSRCNGIKDISLFHLCKETDKKRYYDSICRDCRKELSNRREERRREFKKKCVEYKGGKCEKCGYKKSMYAMEFHHINPKDKEFQISHYKSYVFNDDIKKELDKCQLLCSNCHREIEEKFMFVKRDEK